MDALFTCEAMFFAAKTALQQGIGGFLRAKFPGGTRENPFFQAVSAGKSGKPQFVSFFYIYRVSTVISLKCIGNVTKSGDEMGCG